MEVDMKLRWLVVALAGLAVVAADPAAARSRNKVGERCDARPMPFTWSGVWFNTTPQPNGCTPPVYAFGEYIGQDPDPRIRQQLRQDPSTGYSYDFF
jgi:hypothetical protein